MNRAPLIPILIGIAVILVATIAWQLWDGTDDADTGRSMEATRPQQNMAAPTSHAPIAATALVPAILARPLFATDRRPERPPASTPIERRPADMPRLAGIVTIFDTKLAIFELQQGGKPIVAGEGAEIDGHKIQSIGPEEIVLVGPEGQERLRPLPDPTLQHISRPMPATTANRHGRNP